MTPEVKQAIITAASSYMQEHEMSQNELATKSKINVSYLSNMLRGIFTISVGNKPTEIADSWFKKLAIYIGYKLEKVVWPTIITPQLEEITAHLEEAKEAGTSGMLICQTGAGKSYIIERFERAFPLHTYRITVSDAHSPSVIVDELIEKMCLGGKGRNADKIGRIAIQLEKLKLEGFNPQIVIDEGENMHAPQLRRMKSIFDRCAPHASIIIIGTPELTRKLDTLVKKERDGIPQFCRRFKAGTRTIVEINKQEHFDLFFERLVADKALRKLLRKICNNYGELYDYLFPVMREADRVNKPLSEHLFRMYHNIPEGSEDIKKFW